MRYFLLVFIIFFSSVASAEVTLHTINVTGQGKVEMEASIATVTAGVITVSKTPREAIEANEEKIKRVFIAFKEFGIEPKDMQTSQLSLYPQRQRNDGNSTSKEIVRYHAENMLTVRIIKLEDTGEILNALVDAGVTNIQNISFNAKNRDEALVKSNELAYLDARTKAERYASLADVKITAVQSITEHGSRSAPAMELREMGNFAASSKKSVSVASGTLVVTSSVNVIFIIEQKNQ